MTSADVAQHTSDLSSTRLGACPTDSCDSNVFTDVNLLLLTEMDTPSLRGGVSERYSGWSAMHRVYACTGCGQRFIIESGDVLNVSDFV